MSPITHFLSGWVFANCARLDRRERALVTLASVAPDVDGLGIVPEFFTRNSTHPLVWFSLYHHSLHTLNFAVVVAIMASALAQQKWKVGLLAMVSFHLHLLEDLAGSRGPDGYQSPIPYLQPFSTAMSLAWRGQWGLNAGENMLLTAALLPVTLWLAWRRGFSPLEMVSTAADAELVAPVRRRFPRGGAAES
jgi:inner membrane protein